MHATVAILTQDHSLIDVTAAQGVNSRLFSSVDTLLDQSTWDQFPVVGVDLRDVQRVEVGFVDAVSLREQFSPQVRLVAISSGGMTIEQARQAVLFADHELDLKSGNPDMSELLAPVRRESKRPLYTISQANHSTILTFSATYRNVLQRMQHIASIPIPVLITGETGTGKSTTARFLHGWSSREQEPFMILACGAVPGELLESDLFGHTRGAFTSANQHRMGRLEAVGAGTLLLDEIDLLHLDQQAKLLRAVETGEYEPVGSVETRKTRARFIFASNVDLTAAVAQQRFRADLYYRVNVLDLNLPPLRQRREDIPLIAVNCLSEISSQVSSKELRVNLRFLQKLAEYDWPGNIRELKNRLLRAALLSPTGLLREQDLGSELVTTLPLREPSDHGTLRLDRRDVERASIERALCDFSQNRTAAAKALGISRATLYKKMSEYGMNYLLPAKRPVPQARGA